MFDSNYLYMRLAPFKIISMLLLAVEGFMLINSGW